MRNTTMQVQIDSAIYSVWTKNIIKKSVLLLSVLFIVSTLVAQNNTSRTISFDRSWSFVKDDLANADEPGFDDSGWRKVNLPHDWSIEDLPNQTPDKVVGPFSKSSIGKASTGWTVGGIGWYRKKFATEKQHENKCVSIYFDGVYMNSDVWINGRHLGNHPYGYTPFYYNLTPYLKPIGQENVIAVKVRNEGLNSRWYSGSGIYRNVYLTTTDRTHVETWGVYITTPEVNKSNATVKINTTVTSKEAKKNTINLITTIVDATGKTVAKTKSEMQLDGTKSETVEQTVALQNPLLWSLDTPHQYKAITEIKNGEATLDVVETLFGVRSIKFDGTKGFLLNDKAVILKGGCIHHDNGPLGSVSIDRAEERKIEILKKNGYNAIRSSHNPPSQQLLDACDRLGMLVVNEAFDTWIRPKKSEDYSLYFNSCWKKDLAAMILRDRNHPSIIMWSIGNEIYEAPDLIGTELVKKLAAEVRILDATRPVTAATVFVPPYTVHPLVDYKPHLENLDVEGYNYFLENTSIFTPRDSATYHFMDTQHASNPKKTFVVSEYYPNWALENYRKSEECPYVIGSFKWTAFDYLGEAGLGKSRIVRKSKPELRGLIAIGTFYKDEWPIFNAYSGDFDLVGNKKIASYYQDVVWRQSPIELLVHEPIADDKKECVATWGFPDAFKSWTWPGQEGKKMQVLVYTRSKVVKLELNGMQIAEQTVPEGSITATFEIDYQPGILVAKGYDNGKKTGTSTLTTTGKPVGIRLVPERSAINADINDLAYVSVEIVDAKGNVVPTVSDLEVTYQLSGNATLAAVGSGSPNDMSSFQQNKKKVYQGKGLVIIRPNGTSGKVILKANAIGLKEGLVEVIMK
jgi:beta-galactosidase